MISQHLKLLFLIQCSILLGVQGGDPDKLVKASASTQCQDILATWVAGLNYTFDPETSMLDVKLGSLHDALANKKCSFHNQVWLELWRVRNNSKREPQFGTTAYFSEFERCNRLEQEIFLLHSSKPLELELNATDIKFHHVVEKDFILRVCPCGRHRHQHQQQSQHQDQNMCECLYREKEKPLCSPLFSLTQSQSARVFPWCQPDYFAPYPKNVVHSPVVNCTSVLFTGELTSCTPLQPYDRVRLSLHLINNSEIPANGRLVCNDRFHFGHESPVILETYIHNHNDTHGDFSIYVADLLPASNYCLQIELVDHPYCKSHLVIGHSNSESSFPRVCMSHMGNPITTPVCKGRAGQVVQSSSGNFYLIAMLAIGLATFIGIVVLCFVWICIRIKRKYPSSRKANQLSVPDIKRCHLSRPMSGYSCQSLESGNLKGYFDHQPILANTDDDSEFVFLLRVSNSTNAWSDDIQVMFRSWIESLGCHVKDLNNPDEDELINQDPEGWIQDVLTHPNVKVVVIEDIRGGVEDDTKTQFESQGQVYALTTAPSTSCTDSTSLAGSSSSSMADRHNKSEFGSQFEIDPLIDDPRHDLAVYASKIIQSKFAGKYNQIIFVRFCLGTDQKSSANNKSLCSGLTPLRRSFLIPHHLSEVREWLHPSVMPKKKYPLETHMSAKEQRLRAALSCSAYDCI